MVGCLRPAHTERTGKAVPRKLKVVPGEYHTGTGYGDRQTQKIDTLGRRNPQEYRR